MSNLNLKTRKETGAHYTPPKLATFVAEAMLAHSSNAKSGLRLLDPSIGDGSLMEALVLRLDSPDVTGFDTDPNAVQTASRRLEHFVPAPRLHLEESDFTALCLRASDADLFRRGHIELFDMVIANPPYVRTQVMGAKKAQILADAFGLSGRVDLYFSFLICIAQVLRPDGIAGVIVSNRFMTTRAGMGVRERLLQDFNILQVVDFGDTKLFEAAVLPAVLILRKKRNESVIQKPAQFSAIYSTTDSPEAFAATVFEALRSPGRVQVNGERFLVRHGSLDYGLNRNAVWRLATDAGDAWLRTVASHTYCKFGDIGKVRVGVKTTADKVFVRSDWHLIPEEDRPELLRTLITHRHARRYRADLAAQSTQILYTHEIAEGQKRAVNLNNFPRAASYLNKHRPQLEARKYVIESGRNWFEIWVPQDPDAWKHPKLVFPDISERPTFWIDAEGGIVNGDCYWIAQKGGGSANLLWLALGVANSRFIEKFYDHVFHNKLYSGRRRFMTQYVECFPLPNPEASSAIQIVKLAKEIHRWKGQRPTDEMEEAVDKLVCKAFGLAGEEIAR